MLESASFASSDFRPPTGPRFLSTRLCVSCFSSSHVRVGAIWAAAETAASRTITIGGAISYQLDQRLNRRMGALPEITVQDVTSRGHGAREEVPAHVPEWPDWDQQDTK